MLGRGSAFSASGRDADKPETYLEIFARVCPNLLGGIDDARYLSKCLPDSLADGENETLARARRVCAEVNAHGSDECRDEDSRRFLAEESVGSRTTGEQGQRHNSAPFATSGTSLPKISNPDRPTDWLLSTKQKDENEDSDETWNTTYTTPPAAAKSDQDSSLLREYRQYLTNVKGENEENEAATRDPLARELFPEKQESEIGTQEEQPPKNERDVGDEVSEENGHETGVEGVIPPKNLIEYNKPQSYSHACEKNETKKSLDRTEADNRLLEEPLDRSDLTSKIEMPSPTEVSVARQNQYPSESEEKLAPEKQSDRFDLPSVVEIGSESTEADPFSQTNTQFLEDFKEIFASIDADNVEAKISIKPKKETAQCAFECSSASAGFFADSGNDVSSKNPLKLTRHDIVIGRHDRNIAPGPAFYTASGKAVPINSNSLENARKLLETADSKNPSSEELTIPNIKLGFSTASGKPVSTKPDSLLKAKKLLETIEAIEPDDDAFSRLHCSFSTAAGNRISVNPDSVAKARNFLESLDSFSSETLADEKENDVNVGFSTASGKAVSIKAESLSKARKMLESASPDTTEPNSDHSLASTTFIESTKGKNEGNDHFSLGFSTASGKKVSVKPDNLIRAKRFLETASIYEVESGADNSVISISNSEQPEAADLVSSKMQSESRVPQPFSSKKRGFSTPFKDRAPAVSSFVSPAAATSAASPVLAASAASPASVTSLREPLLLQATFVGTDSPRTRNAFKPPKKRIRTDNSS